LKLVDFVNFVRFIIEQQRIIDECLKVNKQYERKIGIQ